MPKKLKSTVAQHVATGRARKGEHAGSSEYRFYRMGLRGAQAVDTTGVEGPGPWVESGSK